MNHADASRLATEFMKVIAPGCERVEIAGSLRRGKPEVKDIEIVAEAAFVPCIDLFDDGGSTRNALEDVVRDAVNGHELFLDKAMPRNGPKYKRFVIKDDGEQIAVDLFIADKRNWGNILAIRTGNAQFSHLLVTEKPYGLMPINMRQSGGYLFRHPLKSTDPAETGAWCPALAELIPCPTEEDFFAALGLPMIPPAERTIERAITLAAELREKASI